MFDRGVNVDLFPDELLWLDVYDEDLAFDDYSGSVALDLRDLRDLAGCGVTTQRGGGGLYSMDIVVEAR